MKISWLSTLRAIMTLVYFFAWLSAILAPISIILFSSGVESAFESLGIKIYNVHWTFYMVLTLSIIGYWSFLAMIHHLRKASYRITPYRFMDTQIERHFYQAGLFCVVGSLITKVPAAIYKYSTMSLVRENANLKNGIPVHLGVSFDSFMVILAFGIFLIIISKIIHQAILIQEENDLTI